MRRDQHGLTLLEVLVSVLVVSVGVLGIAALQVTTNVYNESSMRRGQATMLAREIVERMRVNVDETRAGNYDITTLPSIATNCTGAAKDCTPEQIREHDLRLWSARVAAGLPDGDAIIATADPTADPVTITVTLSWTARRSAGKLKAFADTRTVTQAFTFEFHGLIL